MKANRALSDDIKLRTEGFYAYERAELLPFVPENISIVLDVGCSSGVFGALLKKIRPGIEIWGIEPSQTSAMGASRVLDKVFVGGCPGAFAELGNQRFDAIFFNDVLEHLVDPYQVLEEARKFLTPGGRIIASIPNILFYYQIAHILIKQDWKYQESGIMDITHLRFFTKKSMIRMFESSGYRVLRADGINGDNGLKYFLFSLFTLGLLGDWKFPQFVITAEPANE